MKMLGPDGPLFRKDASRFTKWFYHQPWLIPLTYLVLAPLRQVITDAHNLKYPNVGFQLFGWYGVVWVLSMITTGLIIFQAFAAMKHLRGFCEICAHRPLGGPEAAKKKRFRLRAYHRMTHSRKPFIWTLVLMLALGFLVEFLFGAWANVLYAIALFFVIGWLDQANQTHAWLIPWCPWCKDDGRWQEPSPSPDPSMTKVSS